MKKVIFSILFLIQLSMNLSAQWTYFSNWGSFGNIEPHISEMQFFNNRFWLATNNGLYSFSANFQSWQTHTFHSNEINDIYIKNESIWVATNGGGVYYLNSPNGNWIRISKTDGLSSNFVRSICIDSQNNIWFSTYGNGISVKKNNNEWVYYTSNTGLSSNFITSSLIDNQNNLWFVSSNKGLMKFDGTNWQEIDVSDGLVSDKIYSLSMDANNKIWVCGEGGVSIIYNGVITKNIYSNIDGLYGNSFFSAMKKTNNEYLLGSNLGLTVLSENYNVVDTIETQDYVLSILENEDVLYLGHADKGLTVINGNQIHNHTGQHTITSSPKDITCKKDGSVWAITNYNIVEYDGFFWHQYDCPTNSTYSPHICADTTGLIWFIWESKLYTFSDGNYVLIPTDAFDSGGLEGLYIDQWNRIWVVDINGGVHYYYDGSWHNEYSDLAILHGSVFKIKAKSFDEIWFITSNGILRVKNGLSTVFNSSNGLISNHPTDLVFDNNGQTWVSFNEENGGLCVYNGSIWQVFRSELHNTYLNFVFCDSQGGIWAGGQVYYTQKIIRYYNGFWKRYTVFSSPYYPDLDKMIEDSNHNLWVIGRYLSGLIMSNLYSVSIDESTNENIKFDIFPNPTSEQINIHFENSTYSKGEIILFDFEGNKVQEKSFCNSEDNIEKINTQNVANGVYILQIIVNNMKFSQKVIINH